MPEMWPKMARDGPRWAEMGRDGPRWPLARDGARDCPRLPSCSTCARGSPRWREMARDGPRMPSRSTASNRQTLLGTVPVGTSSTSACTSPSRPSSRCARAPHRGGDRRKKRGAAEARGRQLRVGMSSRRGRDYPRLPEITRDKRGGMSSRSASASQLMSN